MHTDKKEGSSETLLFDSTNEFIPKAHTISLRVISELISRHCDTHALQQYTNIERDAHSPRSGIFSLLFWHFNYTCFNIFRLFKWMSSFRTNIRMGDKTHSFFITFLFFLLTGWTKASHWQWHCEHNFYWWWQLWLFTELHQKPIYTYPFHKLILSSLTAACFQLFSFHWKEKKDAFYVTTTAKKLMTWLWLTTLQSAIPIHRYSLSSVLLWVKFAIDWNSHASFNGQLTPDEFPEFNLPTCWNFRFN